MDNKQSSIFIFISQTLMLFAVNILTLLALAALFGEGARGMSSIYQFGSKGLATSTILQFLLSSASIITLKNIYFSERLFRKIMALWRTVSLLFSILAIHILFIQIFHWFTPDNGYAWAGFFICFGGGCFFGSIFMIIKTKLESRQYDELLTHYKNNQERVNEDE